MTSVTRITGAAVIVAATLLGSALSVPPAQAAYTVTLEQDGLNVVAAGSGTLDVTDLSFLTSQSFGAQILPTLGEIFTGPASSTPNDQYHGVITGPTSFGSGSGSLATSGSRVSSASTAWSATFSCQRATHLALLYRTCRPTTMPPLRASA
jgi:hypothetical protein